MKQYELSLNDKAELKYRSLVVQYGNLPKDVLESDKELHNLAAKVSDRYGQFRRRQSSRKFKKFASFIAVANQLEKKMASIPLPLSGSCGDSGIVGSPGIVQS